MMICVLYNRYAYILLDLYGCVVVSFSQKMNLRFESSVNPEGSKTLHKRMRTAQGLRVV